MDSKMRDALAKPFPPEKVKKKRGQGNRMMDYISHGLITERLNDVDPEWSWRPIQTYTYADASGRIHCEGVEVELTIGGVSRVEAGGPQRQDGFANEIKNAYSDALKRAAMRFGVALHMWESLVDAESDEDYADADPLGPVLDHLAGMDSRNEPYADIKQYATERWAQWSPEQQARVAAAMKAIQGRRQPVSIAG
jgi:hypothetical protein